MSMKKALILHGTDGNSKENWFEWLQVELEKIGWNVWVPDLPQADTPNIARYSNFIFSHENWSFDEETILVGHSSGAVAILGLLQHLPEGVKVGNCYLVGAFKNDLGWDALKELFAEPLDFGVIKSKAKNFTFIHSDNDPYCPLEHAEFLSTQLNGELIIKEGQGHFSTGNNPEYTTFSFLLDLIKKDSSNFS